MGESKQVQVQGLDLMPFLEQAVSAVSEGVEDVRNKRVTLTFSSDYASSVVKGLQKHSQFAKYSETEIKMALKPLFTAIVLNAVATNLKVIAE